MSNLAAISGHGPGNYVVGVGPMGVTAKARHTATPIDFETVTGLSRTDGISAQRTIAGLAFTEGLEYPDKSIEDTVSDILTACGIFQNLNRRVSPKERSRQ